MKQCLSICSVNTIVVQCFCCGGHMNIYVHAALALRETFAGCQLQRSEKIQIEDISSVARDAFRFFQPHTFPQI